MGKREATVKVNIENYGGRLWTGLVRFGILCSGGLLRHDEVLRSAMKGGELMIVTRYVVSWGGVVGIATELRAQLSGSGVPVGSSYILFSETSKLALGPT